MMHPRPTLLAIALTVMLVICAPVYGESAVFLAPETLDATELAALSTMGDNAGVEIARSESLQLLFDRPLSVAAGDSVAIITLPRMGNRRVRGRIRIGRYENGQIDFVGRINFVAGDTVNLDDLIARRCGDAGCNLIEILTRGGRPNREGVRVDYVQINGEVVSVTAPAPEPHVWALMIMGFAAVAWRAKSLRKKGQPGWTSIPPPCVGSGCHKPLTGMG